MFKFLFSLLAWFLTALAWYKVYGKMGIKPWKAFIVFYEEYVRFRLVGHGRLYIPYLILSVISGIVNFVYTALLALEGVSSVLDSLAGGEFALETDLTVLFWINLIFMLVVYLIRFMIFSILAQAFGKDKRFAIGLTLVPIIFVYILAFGNAKFDSDWKKLSEI